MEDAPLSGTRGWRHTSTGNDTVTSAANSHSRLRSSSEMPSSATRSQVVLALLQAGERGVVETPGARASSRRCAWQSGPFSLGRHQAVNGSRSAKSAGSTAITVSLYDAAVMRTGLAGTGLVLGHVAAARGVEGAAA
jgi:hypothetical protein